MIKKTLFVYSNNKPNTESYTYCHIQELDKIHNGSIDEIICNCIDSVLLKDRIKLLSILVSKVKINGLVVIQSIDLYILCKFIMNNSISIEAANNIIYPASSLVDDATTEEILSQLNNINILDSIYDNINRVTTIQRISK